MNKPNQLDHTEKNMKAERQSVGKEISRSGRNTGLMGGGGIDNAKHRQSGKTVNSGLSPPIASGLGAIWRNFLL